MNANAHFLAWIKQVTKGNPNRYVWLSPKAYIDVVRERVYYHV